MNLTYSRIAAGLAAGAIAGLFLSGAAQAITDTVFRYSAPKTGYYSIHPAAMAPQKSTLNYEINYSDGALYISTINSCHQTGLNLPQGAKITSLRVVYSTPDPGTISFRIFRNQLSTSAGDDIVSRSTTGTGRVAETYTLPGEGVTVTSSSHIYGFSVCLLDSQEAFYGARIAYTYTTAGD